jgi:serine/threonine-protein kinase
LRRAFSSALASAVALAFWLLSVPVAAQTDAALAQSLFEQARELMAEGRYAQACPKLEESQRLDPGGGTLLNLAACHEKLGRTATAWAEYKEALGIARRDGRQDRMEEATARIAELEPRLRRLRIVVSPGNPTDLAVSRDGVPVGSVLWGSSVPVDPGTVVVRAEAPGFESFEGSVSVAPEGEHAEIVIPVLERSPSWEMSATALPPPRSIAPVPPRGEPAAEPAGPPVLGYTLLGVGAVGLGVGTYFGLRALDKKAESDAICDQSECPAEQSEAVDLHDEAVTSAWISNVAFGVGIAGIGIGALLVLTHDGGTPKSPVALTLGPREAGLRFTGAW